MNFRFKISNFKLRSRGLIVFHLALLVLTLPMSTLRAQEESKDSILVQSLGDIGVERDFVIGPGKIEVELVPGQERTASFRVTNRLGEERIFRIEVEDFQGSRNPQETIVLLGDRSGPYSLKDYLKPPLFEFKLKHGQQAVIPVVISIPADAEPGGRFGSVLVSLSSDSSSSDGQAITPSSSIVNRLGVLFFVKIAGQVKEEAVLRSFQTKLGRRVFGQGPVDFELLFENLGNVHLNPYGIIRIKNLLNREVGFVELEPWFALPDSLRLREVSWNQPRLFGIYTAQAFINRGYQDIVDEVDFSFLVVPWKPALISLLIVFLLIVLLRFLFRNFEVKKKNPPL